MKMKAEKRIRVQPKPLAQAFQEYCARDHNPGREWSPYAAAGACRLNAFTKTDVVADKDQTTTIAKDEFGTRFVKLERF